MEEFFCGDCFIVARNENISDIIGEIDSICVSENRIHWRTIGMNLIFPTAQICFLMLLILT
jgi:hypothetical protein